MTKLFTLLLLSSFLILSLTYTCSNIGTQTVCYDATCSSGSSLGCNAGGQGQNCRFCGFSPYDWSCDCTSPTPTPTPTPTPSGGLDFTITNNCPYTIWPGIQGRSLSNPGWTLPNKGGWELPAGQSSTVQIPTDFTAGRFWARTNCKTVNGQFVCETGDCGPWVQCAYDGVQRGGAPPATLVEFTLNGSGSQDFYDVSLVDGYNIQMEVTPKSPSTGTPVDYWCKKAGCTSDLNLGCPSELRKLGTGGTVACDSACEMFNQDMYCCRGAYGTPQTCKPSTWPVNYAQIFKSACPTAYSYAYDDLTSTFFCRNTGYDITFC